MLLVFATRLSMSANKMAVCYIWKQLGPRWIY